MESGALSLVVFGCVFGCVWGEGAGDGCQTLGLRFENRDSPTSLPGLGRAASAAPPRCFSCPVVHDTPGWAPGAAYMTGKATDKKAAEGEKVEDPKLAQLAKEVDEQRKA